MSFHSLGYHVLGIRTKGVVCNTSEQREDAKLVRVKLSGSQLSAAVPGHVWKIKVIKRSDEGNVCLRQSCTCPPVTVIVF